MNQEIVYGRCKRCGRPLKTASAKRKGYGPRCWHLQVIEDKKHHRTLFDGLINKQK